MLNSNNNNNRIDNSNYSNNDNNRFVSFFRDIMAIVLQRLIRAARTDKGGHLRVLDTMVLVAVT